MTEEDAPTIRSRQLEVKNYRVHYLQAGEGPPVVLLHGGASDCRDWLGTMAALAHRFTFYAPDLIGFGRSERKAGGYYLSDFIGFIEEFVGRLSLDNPAIVGHSFGGRIGAGVAVRRQVGVRRLVLVDSSGLGNISGFGNTLFASFWALRKLLRLPQPFPRFLIKDGEDYNYVGTEELGSLSIPTLLIWKRYDPYFPVSLARQSVRLIPGARLEVLPGFGHAPAKQNTSAFNRLLLDFLDQD